MNPNKERKLTNKKKTQKKEQKKEKKPFFWSAKLQGLAPLPPVLFPFLPTLTTNHGLFHQQTRLHLAPWPEREDAQHDGAHQDPRGHRL